MVSIFTCISANSPGTLEVDHRHFRYRGILGGFCSAPPLNQSAITNFQPPIKSQRRSSNALSASRHRSEFPSVPNQSSSPQKKGSQPLHTCNWNAMPDAGMQCQTQECNVRRRNAMSDAGMQCQTQECNVRRRNAMSDAGMQCQTQECNGRRRNAMSDAKCGRRCSLCSTFEIKYTCGLKSHHGRVTLQVRLRRTPGGRLLTTGSRLGHAATATTRWAASPLQLFYFL